MTPLPLVSICIPTCNAEHFIAETLACALAQTYAPIEIIISDDGSTDRTLEILKALVSSNWSVVDGHQQATDANGCNVKLFTHDRYGIAENWNFCISQAEGKYIKFLFQDDLLQPDCVARMVDLAEQDEEIGLVFSRREVIYSDDTTLDQIYVDITTGWTHLEAIQSGRSLLDDPNLLNIPLNKIGEPSTVLLRKEVFAQVGVFDHNLVQVIDLDMWLRIMEHYKIGFIDASLSSFRVHQYQQSHQNARAGVSWIDDWRLYFKMMGDQSYRSLSFKIKQSLMELCLEQVIKDREKIEELRSQVSQLYTQLEQTQQEYWQINHLLNIANDYLRAAKNDLADTKDRLDKTNDQLHKTNDQLHETNDRLHKTNVQLDLTTVYLEQSKAMIAAMESSKFWKLRNKWLQLKQAIGLPGQE